MPARIPGPLGDWTFGSIDDGILLPRWGFPQLFLGLPGSLAPLLLADADPAGPPGKLTEEDYAEAARQLHCEVAAIKAVAYTETKRGAFDEQGRPTILYERHIFHKLTNGKYDKEYPDLSNRKAGGYGKFKEQYGKLERASKLNADAARSACSWGMFQIMGMNYREAGYASLDDFVKAMQRSEQDHLRAFVNFIQGNQALLSAIQKHEWASFARHYNGSDYKKNQYDTKIATAYARFAGLVPAKPAPHHALPKHHTGHGHRRPAPQPSAQPPQVEQRLP